MKWDQVRKSTVPGKEAEAKRYANWSFQHLGNRPSKTNFHHSIEKHMSNTFAEAERVIDDSE